MLKAFVSFIVEIVLTALCRAIPTVWLNFIDRTYMHSIKGGNCKMQNAKRIGAISNSKFVYRLIRHLELTNHIMSFNSFQLMAYKPNYKPLNNLVYRFTCVN